MQQPAWVSNAAGAIAARSVTSLLGKRTKRGRRFLAPPPVENLASPPLPTQKKPEQAELESLKIAAEKLDKLLADSEITEDELVEEFRQLRRGGK